MTAAAVLLAIAVTVAGGLGAGGPAVAGTRGAASGTAAVGSASWAVVPTSAGGTPTTGPVTLTFVIAASSPTPQYLDVVNTGTHRIVSASYGVGLVLTGATLGSLTLTLTSCSVAWNASANTCPGTTTVIGTYTGASSSIDSTTAPLSPGGRSYLQAAVSNVGVTVATLTATISTSVSSSAPRDLPGALTTNQ